MLYQLFDWWMRGETEYAYGSPLFRAGIAVLMAFLIVWALGPRVIHMLVKLKVGDQAQFDHDKLNEMLKLKKNVPTMGGILIVVAIFLTTILLANLSVFYVRMGLFCIVWLAMLGGVDDYLKLTSARRGGSRDGLKMWEKLVFQIALGALLAVFIFRAGSAIAEEDRFTKIDKEYTPFNVLSVPFYKGEPLGAYNGVLIAGPVFWIITVVVIAGTSNAVNLTDGMDGLASGCMVLTAAVFMALAVVVGDDVLCNRLLFFHVRGAEELAVMCGAVIGACLGFLWYNGYPAQVFMGDTGSLPLGGLMGFVAIVTRLELMLFIVGGIFVIEAISVLIQIFYFKSTGGKRFFRCAPLHWHFHLGGWSETQVVMRFWLIAALFAAFALATIKLR
ncbi:MAG: phospho-N-acetylmuramoyl-pentapeptide-transferase [Phycisphaerae bacterium]|nr:phospho-N-acetylmuramoyl-pentapeptide-transferase [Phycisphaerae bacterium]